MPCKGKSAARGMEEKFNRGAEEERGALWQKSATKSKAIRLRVGDRKSSSIILNLQVWKKGVSCRRQLGAKDGPLMEMEKVDWCECKKKTEEKAVQPRETKVQQSGVWAGNLESAAKERGSQREVRRTFKMLREVWSNIGIEKIDTHEGVTVKVLLDSSTTGMFIDKRTAAKHGFRLQKLERPIIVRNVDGMNNSRGAITHQVEANVYYKGYVERMRIDVCDLGKTEVILEMPWLQTHNPKINWKTREVKMTRCLPLCGRTKPRGIEKRKRVAILEEKRIVR